MRGKEWDLILKRSLMSISGKPCFVALTERTMLILWRWAVVSPKY